MLYLQYISQGRLGLQVQVINNVEPGSTYKHLQVVQ